MTAEEKIKQIKLFYEKEDALVSSPFIDDQLNVNRDLFQDVTQKLNISFENKIVMDVGCGSGLLANYFDDHQTYLGMDLNKRKTFQVFKDEKHHYTQGNALELPIQSSTVDVAICMDSF